MLLSIDSYSLMNPHSPQKFLGATSLGDLAHHKLQTFFGNNQKVWTTPYCIMLSDVRSYCDTLINLNRQSLVCYSHLLPSYSTHPSKLHPAHAKCVCFMWKRKSDPTDMKRQNSLLVKCALWGQTDLRLHAGSSFPPPENKFFESSDFWQHLDQVLAHDWHSVIICWVNISD